MTNSDYLKNRALTQLGARLRPFNRVDGDFFGLLLDSSDEGVIRNGGRRGTSYGPLALLAPLKKMSYHTFLPDKLFYYELTAKNQTDKSKEIVEHLGQITIDKPLVHLGGGHDHIFPFLMALEKKLNTPLWVLNIDAHLDTRTDDTWHSGTPFRQWDRAQTSNKKHRLYQLGTHHYSNSESNFTPLQNIQQEIYFFDQIGQLTGGFNKTGTSQFLQPILAEAKKIGATMVISLDADALSTDIMEAVSAPNPQGLPLHFVSNVIDLVKREKINSVFGIYEYNPLYDSINQKGARSLAGLIYSFLSRKSDSF